MDAGLAATISPTEQYSDLSDKELDCPFNVRCQLHGQGRGTGREYDLSNHGPSLKSAGWQCGCQIRCEPALLAIQGCGGGTIGKMSRDLMSSRPNGGGHREPSQPASFIAYVV